MNNVDIRTEISNAGLKLWQVADGLGISDTSFSRLLRHELPEVKKTEIRTIITTISEKRQEK